MLEFGGVLFIAGVLFWLWALFDAVSAPVGQVRYLPKLLWIVLIVVFFELGALAWTVLGRPRNGSTTAGGPGGPGRGGWPGGSGHPGQAPNPFRRPAPTGRPVGPDDDPDFLRKL